jgi:hypothetical protein
MVKLQPQDDLWCDTWYWCCVRRNLASRRLWLLWWSKSTLMEPLRTNGNFFVNAILKHFEDNCTLFRIFWYSLPWLTTHSGVLEKYTVSTWEYIPLHSAYLEISDGKWKYHNCCLELQSDSVMMSEFILHFADGNLETTFKVYTYIISCFINVVLATLRLLECFIYILYWKVN